MNVFFNQSLETLVTLKAFFEGVDLVTGDITGNILPILITLVIEVATFGAFAHHADGALFDLLYFSDLLED